MNISKEETIKGVILSFQNAINLYNDAYYLQKKKSFPRAFSLYQLADEEIGKANIFIGLLYDIQQKEANSGININIKKLKSDFLKHNQKKIHSFSNYKIFILFLKQLITDKKFTTNTKIKNDIDSLIKELEVELDKNNKKVIKENNLKNSGLYVNINLNKVVIPEDIINKEITKKKQNDTYQIIFINSIFIDTFHKEILKFEFPINIRKDVINLKPGYIYRNLELKVDLLKSIYNIPLERIIAIIISPYILFLLSKYVVKLFWKKYTSDFY